MNERVQQTISSVCESQPVTVNDISNMVATVSDGTLMLAHLQTGIMWGRIHNKQLTTAHDIYKEDTPFSQPFDVAIATEIRFFNATQEIFFWNQNGQWYQRTITDGAIDGATACDAFDEYHVLWGDSSEPYGDDFTKLTEGAQGLKHVVPIVANIDTQPNDETAKRVCLKVRHYFGEDDNGINTIQTSRLWGIEEVTYGK